MRYRLTAAVAWVSGADTNPDDPRCYVMAVPDCAPLVLDGAAALVWQVAAAGGDVVAEVAELTRRSPTRVGSAWQRRHR